MSRSTVLLLLLTSFCLILAPLSAQPPAAAPYPDFWPRADGRRDQANRFWDIWFTRAACREAPTTAATIAPRHRALMAWIGEMVRAQYPVDQVLDREQARRIGFLQATGRTAAAAALIDEAFAGLEKLAAERETIEGSGHIAGRVVDEDRAPVEGASVLLFGARYSVSTDENGLFSFRSLPILSPRYIVCAQKGGYLAAQAGNLEPTEDGSPPVELRLVPLTERNAWRQETLAVKVAYLVDQRAFTEPTQPSPQAVLDSDLYPANVRRFLKPSPTIDCDDPAIQALAQEIMEGVPDEDRGEQTAVAKAVYDWIVQHIEYDLMNGFPGDPTCGNWQTTFGGWGKSFDDWCYSASDVLRERRAICIEYERLASALLRALEIPARPAPLFAHPVTQWWVQLPNGSGYWANMETSVGHTIYARSGDLNARFPSVGDHAISMTGIDEHAPIHMDWDARRPTLWLEVSGERQGFEHTPEGLDEARAALGEFAQTGIVPRSFEQGHAPVRPRDMEAPTYAVQSRGFALDLHNIGDQKRLTASFPMLLSNQYRETLDAVIWTNKPEWAGEAFRETVRCKETGAQMEWVRVEFELGKR
jgi:transglutaminase-like putative cysteine protease